MVLKDKVVIAVLDSGLDILSPVAKQEGFCGGLELYLDETENIVINENSVDDSGHGTGVLSIISKLSPNSKIFPIKIVRGGIVNGATILIACLKYISENIPCDIINISAGVVCCEDLFELRKVCEELSNKGVIIVSAFDNEGSISYPAAFDCVIGIDGERGSGDAKSYKRVVGGLVDYKGKIIEQRVPWLDGKRETVSGNSFLAPYFSALIANIIAKQKLSFQQVKVELDKRSIGTIKCGNYPKQSIGFSIKKAIVFPFNKEMHSLARYNELVSFNIKGYFDVKYSGKVGKSVRELQNIDSDETIQDIASLDWSDDFDTVILGHTSLLSEAIGSDLESYIVNKCIKHSKNIFSCKDILDREDLKQTNISVYAPHIEALPKEDIRKMHVIGRPVLGVVGTGSSQGKYTIQLALRRELLKQGYKIGQLGTEPTGLLFGMDAVYPVGHEGAVYAKGMDSVYAVNQVMGKIEQEEPDLILFGTQSHTVPFHAGGVQDYPIYQHEVLLGCQADAYILCVCNDAPLDYIKRTVSYLQGLYVSKVIAMVISPLTLTSRWSTISTLHTYISQDEINELANVLHTNFSIPVLSMSDQNFSVKLSEVCLEYFS